MDSTATELGAWLSIPFWKGTHCVLTRRDLTRYIPQAVLAEGFRRGKRVMRCAALASRMSKSDDS